MKVMSIGAQFTVVFLILFLFTWLYRWILLGMKTTALNRSAYRKLKKGQTVKEWFFYTRFKKILPKPWVWTFFIIFFLHIFVLIILIPAVFVPDLYIYTDYIVRGLVVVDGLTYTIAYALLWSPKDVKFERWVKRYRKKDKL